MRSCGICHSPACRSNSYLSDPLPDQHCRRLGATIRNGQNDWSKLCDLNRPDRQFDVAQANTHWFTDITYILTHEGWLYLTVLIDLYSLQVVG